MPHGMWRNSAAQHSQMLEAWFTHLPGVDRRVRRRIAEDEAGLLVSAIRSDDPVLFFDPKDLWQATGEIAGARSRRSRSARRGSCARATR